ncbi:unnamed protein product [Cyclocybe aegerita]|uniref:Ebp2-domain-containing protein n=1 Tax=Cyclocybe aegerita TaxID=1973307 RepID=A0A8S0VRB2_CYCAE|nr:unnamed protein product [Cyclocybe aegerita]
MPATTNKPSKKPNTQPASKPEKGKGKARVDNPKAKSKAVEKAPSPIPVALPVESDSDESEEDEEDDGVDEEGMARLMKLLGEDGLDEVGQAQLEALAGESDSEEQDDDEEGSEGGSDEEEDIVLEGESDDEEDEGSDEEQEEDEAEEAAIPLDEAEWVDEDAVPRQKIEIDNKVALDQIRETIKLDPSLPWTETLVLSYPHTIDVDVNDDLNRELAFYKQALHGANEARALAAKHNFPFTRPSDYFAEMVKSDAHMERIRMRLLNEASGIKKSEDKRKEREGKKFGKQVQIEKLKEREKSKKEMEERLKGLKRKRKNVLDNPKTNDDEFDIAVEDAISDRPAKRGKTSTGKGIPRSARDKKYGFGGAGRRSKQNTRESTDNFDSSPGGRKGKSGFKGAGGKSSKGRHGSKRLGKSRRMASRGKT